MSKDYIRLLKENYSFIRVIKDLPKKRILIFENNINKVMIKLTTGDFSPEVYKILMRIKQDNLPVIFDVSSDGKETVVVEEFIKGISISDILQSGLYNEKGVKAVAGGLCDALFALHSHNIVHRDIKPENVIISDAGQVKLIDFDAARVFGGYKPSDTVIMGTVGFAPPEQFGFSQTDERADIYSLGIMMNVMLTGEHPSKKLYNGKRFKRIIEKCTFIEPAKRYRDVLQLKSDL